MRSSSISSAIFTGLLTLAAPGAVFAEKPADEASKEEGKTNDHGLIASQAVSDMLIHQRAEAMARDISDLEAELAECRVIAVGILSCDSGKVCEVETAGLEDVNKWSVGCANGDELTVVGATTGGGTMVVKRSSDGDISHEGVEIQRNESDGKVNLVTTYDSSKTNHVNSEPGLDFTSKATAPYNEALRVNSARVSLMIQLRRILGL